MRAIIKCAFNRCHNIAATANAVSFQRWSLMPGWPAAAPWSAWLEGDFQLGAPWNKTGYRAPHCFDAAVDGVGNIVDNYIDFDAQGGS